MTEIGNVVKAFGIAAAAITAVTAIGALLKLLALFLEGFETAASGTLPVEIITAIIFVLVGATIPWWVSLD